VDAHDPVGYNNAQMPCGRKAELRSAILWRDRGAIAAGISGKGPGEIRWTASPNLNAFAERFVLSIKTECLNRIVPLGESHLRRAISEYMEHYHEERNHQGLENALITPRSPMKSDGKVFHRERLGSLLSFHYREAA